MSDDSEQTPNRPKPIPIRRTAGHARRTPGEDATEEEEGASPEGRRGGGKDGRGAPAGHRPTPVRASLEEIATEHGTIRKTEVPARRFGVEGAEWIARLAGRALCGTGRSTPKAVLMEIHFCRGDEPDQAVMRLITASRSLDTLYEEELVELFHRSRPVAGDDGRGRGSARGRSRRSGG